jgi:hypothetical protein
MEKAPDKKVIESNRTMNAICKGKACDKFETMSRSAKPYDQAVAHLVDLRDLAQYQGKLEEFQTSIKQM